MLGRACVYIARVSDRSRALMETMMFNPRTSSTSTPLSNSNGNSNFIDTRKADVPAPATLWSKFRLNEWTFSLTLFAFSLAIVLGKLYVNYGKPLSWQIGDRYSLPTAATFTKMYEMIPSMFILPKFNASQLPNASSQYAGAAPDVLIAFYGKYGWLLKATVSGLVITVFNWFIFYNDSSIPGVNPPSPFSPSKQRIHGSSSRIQTNYLVGVLNGVLFFIYMCL